MKKIIIPALVTALALSGEASIGALFRQMLSQDSPEVQLLGALGCGLVKYEKETRYKIAPFV